jgi:uncharacterized protein involved in exopolysaccharide biosynthesis
MLLDGLVIMPNGNHLLLLRQRAESPEVSYRLLNGVVQAYTDRMAEDRGNQASLAITFYENRLQSAQEQLGQTTDALRRFSGPTARLGALEPSRPVGRASAGSTLPTAAVNPELADLMGRLEQDQRSVQEAREALEQAQLDAAAALQGQELGFQVMDPPSMPTSPIRELRKRALVPVAGFVAGVMLSAALLVLLVALDRTTRSATDLAPGARVVGIVPRLHPKRLPRRAGADTTRRAIGFVAGSALPAPRGAR